MAAVTATSAHGVNLGALRPMLQIGIHASVCVWAAAEHIIAKREVLEIFHLFTMT
jgi:hypothetical protein